MSTIVTHASLESYFQQLIKEALTQEGVSLSEASTAYVVRLLCDFTQHESLHAGGRKGEAGTPALFRLYEHAVNSSPREQVHAYRHLGDVALFVGGVFAPHVERSMVSVDYYVGMGESAYHRASILDRSGSLSPLFAQLASSFNRLVEVLTRVAERTTLPVARDVAALYERWARNPSSPSLCAQLRRMGAVPISVGGAA